MNIFDAYSKSRDLTDDIELDEWVQGHQVAQATPRLSLELSSEGAPQGQGTTPETPPVPPGSAPQGIPSPPGVPIPPGDVPGQPKPPGYPTTTTSAIRAGAAGAVTPEQVDAGRGVLGDIGAGIQEAPQQILGGARDAIVNMLDFVAQYSAPSVPGTSEPAILGGLVPAITPEIEKADSVTGGIIRSVAQFLTAFIPANAITGPLAGVSALGQSAVVGAIADVSAFDPKEPRLSNLIQQLPEAVQNPLTDYLAASPEDSDAEGRLKNVIEGLGLGLVTEGVIRAAKVMKGAALADESLAILKSEAGAVTLPGGTPPPTPGPTAAVPTPGAPLPRTAAEIQEAAQASPGKLNPARMDASEEFKTLTASINLKARESGIMAGQTRGSQSQRETAALAEGLIKDHKMTLERILNFEIGTVLNAEEGTAARHIRDAVMDIADELMAAGDAGDEQAKSLLEPTLRIASRVEANVEAASGTEIARALSARQLGSNRAVGAKTFEQLMLRTVQPDLLMEFWKNLASDVEKQAFVKRYEHFSRLGSVVDAFLEARAAGLIGPRSILRNIQGGAIATIWALPERALAGTRPGGEVYMGEAFSMIHGMWQSQREALGMAAKAIATGESQVFPELNKFEYQKAISGEALNLTGFAGRAADVLGEISRVMFRGLVAGDDYFKWINYKAEQYALAYRNYRQHLASGATREQAEAAYEKALTNPPDWLHKQAQEYMAYVTFNDEIHNKLGTAILDIRNDDGWEGQVTRFILPFAKAPMNIAGYAAERTPGINFLSNHFREELAAGGARADLAAARLALGSVVFSVVAGLAGSGYLNGKGPKNPELRKQMIENGWAPYSVNRPDGNPIPWRGAVEPMASSLAPRPTLPKWRTGAPVPRISSSWPPRRSSAT